MKNGLLLADPPRNASQIDEKTRPMRWRAVVIRIYRVRSLDINPFSPIGVEKRPAELRSSTPFCQV
ncbi:hypothetical protein LNP74_05180 [Klebsiella pneumoniae subsp. pneumoniae]|nr:hypothetical protein [Klebsiella pneumoniae subsp. pneumoniae]